MNLDELNLSLRDYDEKIYRELEPILSEIASKSKALASNLKECLDRLKASDRYLRAYKGESIAVKENELSGEEFDIFRKYVRLLRSCTIMCGQESSKKFKDIFMDFFSGTRLELAKELHVTSKD
jgi:hypothetical protein